MTVAIVNVARTPTASVATSAPRPLVSARTGSCQFESPELTGSVAEVRGEWGVVAADGDDRAGAVEARS
jgi:hypothetical protein